MNTQISQKELKQFHTELIEFAIGKALWLKDNSPITQEQYDKLCDEIVAKVIEFKAEEYLYLINCLSTTDDLWKNCCGVRYRVEPKIAPR